jgi:hypothetical protein
VAWKLTDARKWRHHALQTLPSALVAALQSPDVQGHAWNAAFETAVLTRLGIVPARALSCTMQRALAYGLPGKLETAAAALGLPHQKDMAGHRLMLKMSRPLKLEAAAWQDADLRASNATVGRGAEAAIPEISRITPGSAFGSTRYEYEGELGIDYRVVLRSWRKPPRRPTRQCAATGGATSPGTQTARLLAYWRRGLAPDTSGRDRGSVAAVS